MQTEKLINKYIYAFFILLLGIFLFLGVNEFFSSFLGAIVFYTLFKNFMYYLTRRRKLKKAFAAVIIIIISFIIVLLPIGILLSVLFNKIAAIIQEPEVITQYVHKITARLHTLPFKVSTDNMAEKAQQVIAQNVGNVLNSSLLILGSVLMMYFFLFFLLINMNRMEAYIIRFLPFKKAKIMVFGQELVDQTYSNAIGVPLVCLSQGLAAYLSYVIGSVPEAGLWGILTGFSSIVPLVGTAIIWVPVSAYLLADGHTWQGIFVTAYSIAIMANVDNLVRMAVSKKIGDVHPIITVLGVIVGLKYFGLPGLVFGPLIISYFLILIKLYYVAYVQPREQPVIAAKAQVGFVKALLSRFGFFNSYKNVPEHKKSL
jgi:predicted PurR-regulated permease PerM